MGAYLLLTATGSPKNPSPWGEGEGEGIKSTISFNRPNGHNRLNRHNLIRLAPPPG
jgi:hypothetical protein